MHLHCTVDVELAVHAPLVAPDTEEDRHDAAVRVCNLTAQSVAAAVAKKNWAELLSMMGADYSESSVGLSALCAASLGQVNHQT